MIDSKVIGIVSHLNDEILTVVSIFDCDIAELNLFKECKTCVDHKRYAVRIRILRDTLYYLCRSEFITLDEYKGGT